MQVSKISNSLIATLIIAKFVSNNKDKLLIFTIFFNNFFYSNIFT